MARQIQLFENRGALYKILPRHGIGIELGVLRGRNAKSLLQHAEPAKLHLVDIWPRHVCYRKCVKLSADDPRVELHKMSTMEALELFEDEYFDWVYIDAEHTYASVLSELRGYHPKVKSGGWVFGHDFLNHGQRVPEPLGVVRAIIECIQDGLYECYFLTDGDAPSYGLRKLD